MQTGRPVLCRLILPMLASKLPHSSLKTAPLITRPNSLPFRCVLILWIILFLVLVLISDRLMHVCCSFSWYAWYFLIHMRLRSKPTRFSSVCSCFEQIAEDSEIFCLQFTFYTIIKLSLWLKTHYSQM